MANKKITGNQLKMSFSEKKQNTARAKRFNVIKSPAAPTKPVPPKKPTAPTKATPPTKATAPKKPTAPKKATPPAAAKAPAAPKAPNTGTSPATAVKKSNTYVKDRVKRTDALRAKTFKTEADIAKRKVEKLRTGNPLNNKGKAALDLVKKTSKAGKAGKAALITGTVAALAYGGKKLYDYSQGDKKKETAVKAGAKKADSKKPVTVNNAKGKTVYDPKEGSTTLYNSKGATTTYKDSPASFSIVKNKKGQTTTYSDKSGNTKNKKGKTGFNPDGTKSYTKNSKGATYYNNDGTIRRVDNKKGTTYYDKQGKAIVSSNNTSIEQKAKDVMSGKYGSGADRKKALGADYDKVQAIINKQSATSKAKTAPAKTVTAPAAPEKMEIKKAGPIAYTGPKELAMTAEQKMNANIDKLNKEKKKKGGQVLPKAQYGKIVKTAANYIKPAMGAAKSATKSAKIGVKQLSDKYKKVKADNYNKKTAHLRRSEDWEKFNAAESDKKLQRTLISIAGGSTALALYPNKKKSKKK